MPVEPSELVNLVLLIALVPMVLMAVRRVLPTTPKSVIVAAIAMACAYVFTIVEGFAYPAFFNMLEHASLAVAGLGFVACAVSVRRMLGEGARR